MLCFNKLLKIFYRFFSSLFSNILNGLKYKPSPLGNFPGNMLRFMYSLLLRVVFLIFFSIDFLVSFITGLIFLFFIIYSVPVKVVVISGFVTLTIFNMWSYFFDLITSCSLLLPIFKGVCISNIFRRLVGRFNCLVYFYSKYVLTSLYMGVIFRFYMGLFNFFSLSYLLCLLWLLVALWFYDWLMVLIGFINDVPILNVKGYEESFKKNCPVDAEMIDGLEYHKAAYNQVKSLEYMLNCRKILRESSSFFDFMKGSRMSYENERRAINLHMRTRRVPDFFCDYSIFAEFYFYGLLRVPHYIAKPVDLREVDLISNIRGYGASYKNKLGVASNST